jgi:hypothetical protein
VIVVGILPEDHWKPQSDYRLATSQKRAANEREVARIKLVMMIRALPPIRGSRFLNYLITKLPDNQITLLCSYFVLGLAAGGSWAQKPVVWPLSLQHVQSPPQCTVALHVVPQAPGKLWAAVFNCRAETVPASRTVATIVANNAVLPIFLIMIRSSFP